MPGQYPSFTRLSLWQMPQACTRMRTCPAVGLGISRSTISKSAPAFGTNATFIFAIETLRLFILDLRPQVGCTARAIGHILQQLQPTSREQVCAEKVKKVLQRFPKRCTGTPIDAHGTTAHNPRNSLSRE